MGESFPPEAESENLWESLGGKGDSREHPRTLLPSRVESLFW